MRYAGRTGPPCEDVDLEIPAGRTVALVGATGSGKTTLAALVARLYDPTEGRVLIDGADLREVDVASVRGAVAITGDDPFLFSTSVHDNIAYARPDATREQVVDAARRAQADEFIRRLPDGYDTRVGERGLTVSGGQRQRIAIARAILADPRILILDDATSSVDATTEREIKRALAEVMAGRTTFIIAHRLSTIALADEIVVLEDGRVAAHGTHEELLEQLAAVPRDRREGTARQRLPDAQAAWSRRWRGCDRHVIQRQRVAARLRRRLRGTQRPRHGACAASPRCSRPTAAASSRWCCRCHRHRRVAGAGAARGAARSTTASCRTTCTRWRSIVVAFVRRRADRLGRDRGADLPRRMGRPARARRPAPRDLRAPPAAAGQLLRAPPDRRADLAHDQRRRGARQRS